MKSFKGYLRWLIEALEYKGQKAHKFAVELGVDKHLYKRLSEFLEWVVHHQDSILKTKGTELAQVKHNLRLIKHNIDITIDKLN